MGGVEVTLSNILTKMDNVAQALVVTQSKPTWDFNKMLQNFTYMIAIFSGIVYMIIYISTNNSAVAQSALVQKVDAIGERSQLYHKDVQDNMDKAIIEWKERHANLRERLIAVEKYLLDGSSKKNGIDMDKQRFIPSPDDWTSRRERAKKDERNL
jgi:uncharacterized protein with HEPN domain